jgi:hypothetical protein
VIGKSPKAVKMKGDTTGGQAADRQRDEDEKDERGGR